jgi:hypothetical protein
LTDRATWSARARAGLRFSLIALVAQLLSAIALLPPSARFLAPLGFLLPWRGPRAALVSLLLDVPLVAAAAGAAWVLGRVGEGAPRRRAAVLVVLLWFFDAGSGLFVNANLDRWMDGWSVAARAAAMIAGWAAARWVLARAARPTPPAAPPAGP